MTRYSKRKTTDRLHCTFSAIIDILEMEYHREPTGNEVNKVILLYGDKGAMVK